MAWFISLLFKIVAIWGFLSHRKSMPVQAFCDMEPSHAHSDFLPTNASSGPVPSCLCCFQALIRAGGLRAACNRVLTVPRSPAHNCPSLLLSWHTHSAVSPPPIDLRCLLSHPFYSLLSAAMHPPSFSSCKVLNACKKTKRESLFASLPGSPQIFNWIIDPDPHKAA